MHGGPLTDEKRLAEIDGRSKSTVRAIDSEAGRAPVATVAEG